MYLCDIFYWNSFKINGYSLFSHFYRFFLSLFCLCLSCCFIEGGEQERNTCFHWLPPKCYSTSWNSLIMCQSHPFKLSTHAHHHTKCTHAYLKLFLRRIRKKRQEKNIFISLKDWTLFYFFYLSFFLFHFNFYRGFPPILQVQLFHRLVLKLNCLPLMFYFFFISLTNQKKRVCSQPS